MLEAQNLRKTYAAESSRVDAVRDISLRLEAGQFLAVVGRSGSGKSIFLAMLGGLCRPTSGTVLLNGVDLWTRTEAERAAFRNREVGHVFQFAGLLPTLGSTAGNRGAGSGPWEGGPGRVQGPVYGPDRGRTSPDSPHIPVERPRFVG